jgi:S-DNA-T family DNA segregation ATPase FtsK/SpoIIIE
MIEDLKVKLLRALSNFSIYGEMGEVVEGPLLYNLQFKLADGSKFSIIESRMKDISREIGISGVRVSQIPNSVFISFEIPKEKPQTVPFAPIVYSAEFIKAVYALPICMGVNMFGEPVMKDLSKMPHLLVAGTTGSGKSVGLNSFILSLINKKKPDELKLVLIDPKRIEFSLYNNQQYLLRPVITDMNSASACLSQLVGEMEERYTLFEKEMVRNIGEYHKKGGSMAYIVCVIDEFADLIMFDKSVEKLVQTLAQKSRAAGIHLIIATQRPSVDVITGTVKANLPTRLSYKVSSPADSMTILNTDGAEDLLGKGDSLLLEENGTLTRILGAYVSDEDINDTLQLYRCKIEEPRKFNDIVREKQEEIAKRNEQNRKEKGFWGKVWDFWCRLGKRNQNRIINMIVGFVMAIFGFKSTTSSSTRSIRDGVQKTAKKITKRK